MGTPAAATATELPRLTVVFGLWQCDKENQGWREGPPLTVACEVSICWPGLHPPGKVSSNEKRITLSDLTPPDSDSALAGYLRLSVRRSNLAEPETAFYESPVTILTSQLPVSRWHEQIGDPTLADGILDRLVHNAHRIEMRGDSMRKSRGKQSGQPA